jgi:hypothetical protein
VNGSLYLDVAGKALYLKASGAWALVGYLLKTATYADLTR